MTSCADAAVEAAAAMIAATAIIADFILTVISSVWKLKNPFWEMKNRIDCVPFLKI